MDTGSVIAVVAAQIVALAAICVGLLQQRRAFANERELTDLESVRGLLSQAASVLHRVEYALDEAHSTLLQWGGAFFDDEERARPYRELEKVGRELDELLGQLRIRLGPRHPATLALDDADTALLDSYRALGLIRLEEHAPPGTPTREEFVEVVETQRERVANGRENFKAAQEQFIAAAHAATGARLPG